MPADDPRAAEVRELAPRGRIRVAINYGNPVLAQRDPVTGEPRGVSAAIARELARRTGVDAVFATFDAVGKVFAALAEGAWDVAFLAIDPDRAREIEFTAPYVIIEGTYLVPTASPLTAIADVDRAGVRIAVAAGSAYDLYLTRTVKHAQLVRAATGPEAIDRFLRERLEVVAGAKSPLQLCLDRLLDELIASGFVAAGLRESGQADAKVAPRAGG